MRMISDEGRELIKKWETLQLKAYLCPAKVWTVGYGHTGDVKKGDVITEHQADAILIVDLERFESAVERLCPGTTQPQFDALVSFAFNLGAANLEKSNLRKRYLAGDLAGAQAEFAKWVYAKGKKLNGLVKRRAEEAALFGRVMN